MVSYDGTSPPGDVASGVEQGRQGVGRWRLATAAGWLALGLACVALAVVEHERSRAAATGSSVLCGSLLSCSDAGLEHFAAKKAPGRVMQKLEEEGEEEGDGSEKPESVEQAIDGFDIFTFGGEAPDSYEDPKYFERYMRPGDQGQEGPQKPPPNALDAFIGQDNYVHFTQHSEMLQPGDVPYDMPQRHHEKGFFNFFGALADKDQNLLTGETEQQACCLCIPGAPDYRKNEGFESFNNPLTGMTSAIGSAFKTGLEDAEQTAGVVEEDVEYELGVLTDGAVSGAGKIGGAVTGAFAGGGGAAGGGENGTSSGAPASAPAMDGDMPVVEAFPLVEAEPAPEASPPEEAGRRRLLAVPKSKPGYNVKGRVMQKLDGYMLVHVPDSAEPGTTFKATTPSGQTWAFKVPENLPEDRIIKLHLPDLKAKKGVAMLRSPLMKLQGKAKFKHAMGKMLDEEAPAEEAPAEEAPAEEGEPVADGNATATGEEEEEGGEEGAKVLCAHSVGDGNATDGNATDGAAVDCEERVWENVTAGQEGEVAEAKRAGPLDPCCMCPLYDKETGEIEGWIADAPNDPNGAAVTYIAVAEAIADREEHVDDVMGEKDLDPSWLNPKLRWEAPAEEEIAGNETTGGVENANATLDANANATLDDGNTTDIDDDGGNATDANATVAEEAPADVEAAAEAAIVGAHLAAQHRVTHLHQKVPVAQIVQPVAHEARASHMPTAVAAQRAKAVVQAHKKTQAAAVAQKKAAAVAAARVAAPKPATARPATARPATARPAPLQAVAEPLPAGKAAELPKAVEEIVQTPKLPASHVPGMKAKPVAARAGPDMMPPVQAVAEPMTAAVAAEDPVQAIAHPVVPPQQ